MLGMQYGAVNLERELFEERLRAPQRPLIEAISKPRVGDTVWYAGKKVPIKSVAPDPYYGGWRLELEVDGHIANINPNLDPAYGAKTDQQIRRKVMDLRKALSSMAGGQAQTEALGGLKMNMAKSADWQARLHQFRKDKKKPGEESKPKVTVPGRKTEAFGGLKMSMVKSADWQGRLHQLRKAGDGSDKPKGKGGGPQPGVKKPAQPPRMSRFESWEPSRALVGRVLSELKRSANGA